MKTKTQIKAAKSLEYQIRMSSKCRHERCQISCFSCPEESTCDIQRLITIAKSKR